MELDCIFENKIEDENKQNSSKNKNKIIGEKNLTSKNYF